MLTDTETFVATFLLSLGVVALVLAAVTALFSTRQGRLRSAALAVVGTGALVAMAYVLWPHAPQEVWDEMLWPLLVLTAAMASGLAAGASLVYLLVAAR